MSDTKQVPSISSSAGKRRAGKPENIQAVWEYAPDARASDAIFQAFTLLLKDDIGYPQEPFDGRGEPVH